MAELISFGTQHSIYVYRRVFSLLQHAAARSMIDSVCIQNQSWIDPKELTEGIDLIFAINLT